MQAARTAPDIWHDGNRADLQLPVIETRLSSEHGDSSATGESVHREFGQGEISVCHVLPGERWAGLEVQAATQLKALAKVTDIHLSAILLTEGRLAEEIRNSGVEVTVFPQRNKSFVRILSEVSAFLRQRRVHILHSHRYKENLLSTLLARRCHVPYLVRTQHGRPEKYSGVDKLKSAVVYAVDRFLAKRTADRVIGVSGDLTKYLRTFVDPKKIAIVHNSVDLWQVRSGLTPAAAKERLGLPADVPVFGSIGRLDTIKRPELFLDTARYILQQLPNAKFVMAGEGRQESCVRQTILGSDLAGRVHLLGQRHDVYDVLRALDLLLICSDHEGLPTVLLEAMALRIPVVSRAVGGVPEVIQDGVHGVLVASDDARTLAEGCVSVLSDKRQLERLKDAAYQRVWLFSAERKAAQLAEIYRSLLASNQNHVIGAMLPS